MSNGQISPPNEPITKEGANINPSWYRYLVQRKHIEDGVTDAGVLTFDDEAAIFPNGRRLTVGSGELTAEDTGSNYELGLADTAVTPDTYGEPTKLVVLAIDRFGRVTSASEVALESGNVTETTKLFFTQARARASVSGSAGISYTVGTGNFVLDQAFARGLFNDGSHIDYNSGTGVISFDGTGISGTFSPPLSITVVDGLITAIS